MKNVISLRAAISLMMATEWEGQLNDFGLKYYKTNGQPSEKRLACRGDALTSKQEKREPPKRPGTAYGKTGFRYSVYKARVLKLYDLDKNQHFSVKVDLITHLYHQGAVLQIDHVSE